MLKVNIVEEKFGDELSDSDESSSEDEDEDGDLQDPNLDAQFMETLRALRGKDPRVKDKSYRFFSEIGEGGEEKQQDTKKAKPMTLKDYHRQNILEGGLRLDDDEHEVPKSYVEEQEDLKRRVVKEMHAGLVEGESDSEEEDEGFLVRTQKSQESRAADITPMKPA